MHCVKPFDRSLLDSAIVLAESFLNQEEDYIPFYWNFFIEQYNAALLVDSSTHLNDVEKAYKRLMFSLDVLRETSCRQLLTYLIDELDHVNFLSFTKERWLSLIDAYVLSKTYLESPTMGLPKYDLLLCDSETLLKRLERLYREEYTYRGIPWDNDTLFENEYGWNDGDGLKFIYFNAYFLNPTEAQLHWIFDEPHLDPFHIYIAEYEFDLNSLPPPVATIEPGESIHGYLARGLDKSKSYYFAVGTEGDETYVLSNVLNIGDSALPDYHELRVEMWSGELDTLPENYLILDGSLLDRRLYPMLYRWLGHTYAMEGDDLEGYMFRLPDLRGRTLLGVTADEEVGKYQEDKVMWHGHTSETLVSGAFPGNRTIAGGANNRTALTLPQGTETRMKNISVYFILNTMPSLYKNTIGEIAFNPSFKVTNKALVCDGSEVSRVEYAKLYAVIGDTYGAGDGTNTFNLPDINDVYIRATALGSVVDTGRTSRLNRGDGTTGDAVGTRQLSQIKSHNHIILDNINQGTATGWIRGFGTRIQIGMPLVNSAAPIGGKERDNINVQTPVDIPWDVYNQAPDLYIDNPFIVKDAFDDKNHMRAVKMKAVIFYDA